MIRRIQTAEHFEGKPMSWWKRETVPERYEFLLTFLQHVKAANVLEIGSGRGAFAFAIRDLGIHVYGIEINRAFIEYCRGKRDRADVEFIQGNAEMLPFREEYFDAVIGIEVLMHVPNPSVLLSEISRVLNEGGYAIISYLKKYTGDYLKKTVMRFSGIYALKYGKHAFDYRYDTLEDIVKYAQGSNLVITEIHNEENGNPCLILRKTRA